MFADWEDPDRWVADGAELDLRTRTLRAVRAPAMPWAISSTTTPRPGHLHRNHVLPHVTPSIGFEPAGNRMALRDYLSSLARTLALPDARLLPAHGPVTGSTHERVNELLAHHDDRLAETLDALRAGHATPFEVAKAIKWTRRQRLFDHLDLFAQIQAATRRRPPRGAPGPRPGHRVTSPRRRPLPVGLVRARDRHFRRSLAAALDFDRACLVTDPRASRRRRRS